MSHKRTLCTDSGELRGRTGSKTGRKRVENGTGKMGQKWLERGLRAILGPFSTRFRPFFDPFSTRSRLGSKKFAGMEWGFSSTSFPRSGKHGGEATASLWSHIAALPPPQKKPLLGMFSKRPLLTLSRETPVLKNGPANFCRHFCL